MSKLKERILWMTLGSVLTLAVLLLVLVFALPQLRTTAAIASTTAQVMNYRAASTNFFARAGRWPTSAAELVTNSMGLVFISPSPPIPDSWGRHIVYQPYTSNAGYGRVISYGRDGRPGGIGPDADIEQRFP
jgi:hypothetical protein